MSLIGKIRKLIYKLFFEEETIILKPNLQDEKKPVPPTWQNWQIEWKEKLLYHF